MWTIIPLVQYVNSVAYEATNVSYYRWLTTWQGEFQLLCRMRPCTLEFSTNPILLL